MWYMEFLRMRRALVTYALVLFGIAIAIVVGLHAGHVWIGADAGSQSVWVTAGHETKKVALHKVAAPFAALVALAGFCAIIFALIVPPSMNAEHEHLNYVFTRPVPRMGIGAQYVATDLAGLLAAWAIALAITLVPVASVGEFRLVYFDAEAFPMFLLALGVAFMWYAEKQVMTSWYRDAGGRIGMLSAIVFFVLTIVAHFNAGPVLNAIIVGLNYLNPFAYLHSLTVDSGGVTTKGLLPIDMTARILLVWLIGLASCVAAVANWRRVEA